MLHKWLIAILKILIRLNHQIGTNTSPFGFPFYRFTKFIVGLHVCVATVECVKMQKIGKKNNSEGLKIVVAGVSRMVGMIQTLPYWV